MLATEGTGRCAHRSPASACAWLLDSSVPLPPQQPTHRFREPKKIRRPSGRDGGLACIAVRPRVVSRATTTTFQVAGSSRSLAPIHRSRPPPLLLYRSGHEHEQRAAPKHTTPRGYLRPSAPARSLRRRRSGGQRSRAPNGHRVDRSRGRAVGPTEESACCRRAPSGGRPRRACCGCPG